MSLLSLISCCLAPLCCTHMQHIRAHTTTTRTHTQARTHTHTCICTHTHTHVTHTHAHAHLSLTQTGMCCASPVSPSLSAPILYKHMQHIRTHTHTHTHTHAHAHTRAHTHTHAHAQAHAHTHISHTHTHTHTYSLSLFHLNGHVLCITFSHSLFAPMLYTLHLSHTHTHTHAGIFCNLPVSPRLVISSSFLSPVRVRGWSCVAMQVCRRVNLCVCIRVCR